MKERPKKNQLTENDFVRALTDHEFAQRIGLEIVIGGETLYHERLAAYRLGSTDRKSLWRARVAGEIQSRIIFGRHFYTDALLAAYVNRPLAA